jgi:hypothetical protein
MFICCKSHRALKIILWLIPVARQRPHHTRGQQYSSGVLCGSRSEHILACEVASHDNRSCALCEPCCNSLLGDATVLDKTWRYFGLESHPVKGRLACDLKTLCMLQRNDIWSVNILVHVLKSTARKRIMKILQRNIHFWELLRSLVKEDVEDRRLSAKLMPTFADIRCRVAGAADPHSR